MTERPIIAITMGDVTGVGPEVVAAALASTELQAMCRMSVVGDAIVLQRAVRLELGR